MKTAVQWLIEKLEEEKLIFNHGLVERWKKHAFEIENKQKQVAFKKAIEEVIFLIDNTIDINGMIGSQIYPNTEKALVELKHKIEKYTLKESPLMDDCFAEKIILKDGYRACCGKEMTDEAAEKYCKDVWLKT